MARHSYHSYNDSTPLTLGSPCIQGDGFLSEDFKILSVDSISSSNSLTSKIIYIRCTAFI